MICSTDNYSNRMVHLLTTTLLRCIAQQIEHNELENKLGSRKSMYQSTDIKAINFIVPISHQHPQGSQFLHFSLQHFTDMCMVHKMGKVCKRKPSSAELRFVHWNNDLFDCFESAATQEKGFTVIGSLPKY